MALILCPECGKNVSDSAYVCPHCGYQLLYPSPMPVQYKVGIPGRGFGISSMIMGIFGLIYGFVAVNAAYSLSFIFGNDILSIVILPAIFAILALSFGSASNSRGYSGGSKSAGLFMGVISLVLCAIAIALCA